MERKVFVANDGERLALVVFEEEKSEAVWRDHVTRRRAQQRGRKRFYQSYDMAVCEVLRRRSWAR